jgi:ribosome-interacting GTPase 1
LTIFIDKIPEYIQKINDKLTRIESIYKEEEYNKQTKKFIKNLKEKIL